MKVAVRGIYNLKVMRNPSGMGWVIQDVETRSYLTRTASGELKFHHWVRYNAKLAKLQGGWCDNGSLWPSPEAAQSFLDGLKTANDQVEEADHMAAHALAWAVGFGGKPTVRPFKSFLVRPRKGTDWGGLNEWVAEGHGAPNTPIGLFTSDHTVQAVVDRIRKAYPTEDIYVDNLRNGLIQVDKKEQTKAVVPVGEPEATYRSRFGIGDHVIYDPGVGPSLAVVQGVLFEQSRTRYMLQHCHYRKPQKDVVADRHLFTLDGWRSSNHRSVDDQFVKIRKEYEDAIGLKCAEPETVQPSATPL